jgi:hypothetical protein
MPKCWVCREHLKTAGAGLNTIWKGHYVHRSCVGKARKNVIELPSNFVAIRIAMGKADRSIRKASVCPICGLPKAGIIHRVSGYTIGKVTGNTYVSGDVMSREDSGLCICKKE